MMTGLEKEVSKDGSLEVSWWEFNPFIIRSPGCATNGMKKYLKRNTTRFVKIIFFTVPLLQGKFILHGLSVTLWINVFPFQ